ncbi:MAG: PRC-barrel domain-containing protein [Patescibacteria group bacterium]
MSLMAKQLIGMPVYTQSDEHLGKVSDFVVDLETQNIRQYSVRSRDLIAELLQRDLLISREQVIRITEEKMIVEDSILAETEQKKQPANKPVPAV